MTTQYVYQKSELTATMNNEMAKGREAYRTRMYCACQFNNRRNGILVLEQGIHVHTIIRCKNCKNGGNNGM